ncbi:MAG: hypothetical protein M3Q07_24550 [Pseudobdellovibrionaceae bacterium]|nr:hypothetical protein [Pseudobdellovibrionaceae bacterium]
MTQRFALEFEAEGNHASSAIFNGDEEGETTGALLDSSLKLTAQINRRFRAFGSLRSISGGSRGTARDQDPETGDGFSSNWIDLAAFSIGVVANLDAF